MFALGPAPVTEELVMKDALPRVRTVPGEGRLRDPPANCTLRRRRRNLHLDFDFRKQIKGEAKY